MNLPSDTPKLPKWIFFLSWACLLGTAWVIATQAANPAAGMALISIVGCVIAAFAIVVIPFVADYAWRQDEALDNRQRSLQSLSVTVASSSEQIAIAATGLQGLAEAAQDNLEKSERISKQIQEKIAELQSILAASRKDDGEAFAKLESAAKRIAGTADAFEAGAARLEKAAAKSEAAAARSEAAAMKAAEAARSVPALTVPIIEVPPVPMSRIVRIKPAAAPSESPFEAPAAAPVADAAPLPEAPPATAAAPEPVAEPVPRKRNPRKPAAAPAPAPDLVLESPPAPDAELPLSPSPPEIAEPAVSSDGATRLVVTAYIGIGNRLFIRGEGPGLSWEKGVPLSFVSIGKWRWETNDATKAVAFKLYKNDEVECSALGERSVEPGAQQDLTAAF